MQKLGLVNDIITEEMRVIFNFLICEMIFFLIVIKARMFGLNLCIISLAEIRIIISISHIEL
jgi:hypothetical protein